LRGGHGLVAAAWAWWLRRGCCGMAALAAVAAWLLQHGCGGCGCHGVVHAVAAAGAWGLWLWAMMATGNDDDGQQ